MNTLELDTQPAGSFAYAAARDASIRNCINRSLYTELELRKTQTAVDLLDMVYKYSKLYVNYRKKFIAIKITDAQARSRRQKQELEQLFADAGYSKVVTAQGTTYRLFTR